MARRSKLQLAEALFLAVEEADTKVLLEIYSEDAVLANNLGSETMAPRQIAAMVSDLIAAIPDYTYQEVRCEPTPSGFVRRHVVTGTSPAGEPFAIAACCVAEVRDGRVARLDEYVDSTALEGLGL